MVNTRSIVAVTGQRDRDGSLIDCLSRPSRSVTGVTTVTNVTPVTPVTLRHKPRKLRNAYRDGPWIRQLLRQWLHQHRLPDLDAQYRIAMMESS